MEFKDLNPLLHNELRLKIMAALDSLDDADFSYLKGLTKATAGNLSVQLSKLEEAGYIKISSSGRLMGVRMKAMKRMSPQPSSRSSLRSTARMRCPSLSRGGS